MKGYVLPMSCPECGGPLEHVNASKVDAGSCCSAIARCMACRVEFSVHVQLRRMPRFQGQRGDRWWAA